MTRSVPEGLASTIVEVHRERGAAWLREFPALVTLVERRWSLTLREPFPALTYQYVAPATLHDGTPVVVKMGVPNPELSSEIAALTHFDGRGAARLTAADGALGVLVLERLRPGESLHRVADDAAAISAATRVMRALWRPAPPDPTLLRVDRWARGFQRLRRHYDGATGPLPSVLVERAEVLFADLLASMGPPVLLHGDLHFGNILSATREPWLAIDPKGLVGEPAYDAAILLRDPLPELLIQPRPGLVLARRAEQLAAELEIDRTRLVRWGMAQAVLSAWWSIEDHGRVWEPAIACAQLLAQMLR